MRNLLILAALIPMVFGAMIPTVAAPFNPYAETQNARATALADCERQARAKRFGKLAIQRRNFLKDCMIDRGFYAQTN
jgi:hypothetical protein